MSTHALRTSDGAGEESRQPRPAGPGALLARNLDLAVLGFALPVFVFGKLSLSGYAVIAAVWLVQRGIGALLQKRADASEDPKVVVGLLAGGSMARAWLTALSILAAGLVLGERAGLAAVLLAMVLFTTHFVARLLERSTRG